MSPNRRRKIEQWKLNYCFSLLIHFCWYICILAAPFPIPRLPTILTPRIYAGSLIYMLTINFGMVFVSYRAFDGTDFLTEEQAILGLSLLTILCIISG